MLFFRKKDKLEPLAQSLYATAKSIAISSFKPVSDRHLTLLEDVDLDRWDLLMTIAGVFIAASRLLELHPRREEKLMEIVAKDFHESEFIAFDNCRTFFDKEYDRLENQIPANLVASTAIGMWIVWNLLDRQPESDEELTLVNEIGILVVSGFHDYWS